MDDEYIRGPRPLVRILTTTNEKLSCAPDWPLIGPANSVSGSLLEWVTQGWTSGSVSIDDRSMLDVFQ